MRETPSRVVGIVDGGSRGLSTVVTVNLSVAMAAAGRRVVAGAIDPARADAMRAGCEPAAPRLTWLPLPRPGAEPRGDRTEAFGRIETAGRWRDRVVLDLGPSTNLASALFGSAVDDLVLLVGAGDDHVRRAATFVDTLARDWARDDLMVLWLDTADPMCAATRLRRLLHATRIASPRVVPLGCVPPHRALSGATTAGAALVVDEPDGPAARALQGAAARLLEPCEVMVRGGLQFFLEERIDRRRIG